MAQDETFTFTWRGWQLTAVGMAWRDLGRPQLKYVLCEVAACISQEAQYASVRSVDKCQIGTVVCCKIHTYVWAKCGLLGVKPDSVYGGERGDVKGISDSAGKDKADSTDQVWLYNCYMRQKVL
jgi:hypothetical protein